MTEPIIFLDVDGVLNHRGVFLPGNGPAPLCHLAVKRFIDLVALTGALVVVSSTWRLDVTGKLAGNGSRYVTKMMGAGVLDRAHTDWRTVQLPVGFTNGVIVDAPVRGHEIAEWLSRHPEHPNYVIIDDDGDMLPEQMPRFVQTSFTNGGLLDSHCQRAAEILGVRTEVAI